MDKILIETADRSDLQKILDLQYLAFQSVANLFSKKNIPPLTQTLDDLENEYNNGVILKAIENDVIVGSVRWHVNDETTHIGKLIVNPKCQGRGIGTKLLLEIEKYSLTNRYELFTSTKSPKNINLYEKLGFELSTA